MSWVWGVGFWGPFDFEHGFGITVLECRSRRQPSPRTKKPRPQDLKMFGLSCIPDAETSAAGPAGFRSLPPRRCKSALDNASRRKLSTNTNADANNNTILYCTVVLLCTILQTMLYYAILYYTRLQYNIT